VLCCGYGLVRPAGMAYIEPPGAPVPAVISSPIFDVFAVNAAAPGPRRGHVIYSGVSAAPEVM
jgi:hypothetical protein